MSAAPLGVLFLFRALPHLGSRHGFLISLESPELAVLASMNRRMVGLIPPEIHLDFNNIPKGLHFFFLGIKGRTASMPKDLRVVRTQTATLKTVRRMFAILGLLWG